MYGAIESTPLRQRKVLEYNNDVSRGTCDLRVIFYLAITLPELRGFQSCVVTVATVSLLHDVAWRF
jgi:hypothetical protein